MTKPDIWVIIGFMFTLTFLTFLYVATQLLTIISLLEASCVS